MRLAILIVTAIVGTAALRAHEPLFSQGRSPASAPAPCCATCNDCVRITETKKTPVPVYSCKIKEICVPSCSLFGGLFGGECRKIEVRQLVKRIRTDEECVSKCVTAEEAAKRGK